MATRAGSGLSENPDAAQAAREAAGGALRAAGMDGADWAIVFATMPHRPHFAALLGEVQAVTGASTLTGCSGAGVIGGGQEVEDGPAVAVLVARSDRITALALLEPAGDDHGRTAATGLARRAGPDAGLLVTLPDPFTIRLDPMLEAIETAAPGLRLVGAAAAGAPRATGTFQFCGRNVATASLAALRLGGDFRSAIGVTQGCQPLGPPCRVDRAKDNVVLELDGRPALDVLRSRLPASLGDSLARLGGHLFVGLPPDPAQTGIEPGEYLVRPLFAVDPARGALVLGDEVREGQSLVIVLRDSGAARDDLKAMLGRLARERDPSSWSFGLYFNCAGRGAALHGLPGVDSAFIARQFPRLPIAGVFGNAEIAPLRGRNHLFTYTGVLALCGESGGGAR
jgi:small ligand-binding sensory domain FIST